MPFFLFHLAGPPPAGAARPLAMHPSSFENMQKCHDRYLVPANLAAQGQVRVLDLGGADVNGSYRPIFAASHYRYLTADIAAAGVDIPLEDPYRLPLADASVDVVLSGQMLEHCEFFWLTFQEMVRVMKPDGFLFLIAPSAGPIHRYPVDCYRFYPDAYAALARLAQCRLEATWLDERGPWRDLVGVFRKRPLPPPAPASAPPAIPGTSDWDPAQRASPAEERVADGVDYAAVLALAHEQLAPDLYLEIGVRYGRSLALARGPAIGVDPLPAIDRPLPATTRVIASTSDDFFESEAARALAGPPDLVFIDGMHLFEYALRDFMQVERRSSPTTLVLVDDIFPNHPHQADRRRRTQVWTGDVWKLHACLREWRPDLFLLALDTAPTGLLLIAGLDAANRVLWDNYNPLVRHYREAVAAPPEPVLARAGGLDPTDPRIGELLRYLRQARGQATPSEVVGALRACC